jgi:hypothetical protein
MAVTIQFATEGVVNEWLLDIVEVAQRHTSIRLANEFVDILDAFDIRDKVSSDLCILHATTHHIGTRFWP